MRALAIWLLAKTGIAAKARERGVVLSPSVRIRSSVAQRILRENRACRWQVRCKTKSVAPGGIML
ncbi:MAG: hypothetical protein COY42_17080 [Armatimonadetes bacterium CG_4_10_14_0_8_um_filter_66_14]|nr:MAG: hypothetical protein COY42_17080 [Armatimonadetes bacterium CG_4_10_14_0_8_um_filter_66_14]